jgi:hypothetical protein
LDIKESYIALINLRTGLGVSLAKQFIESNFNQIIYIGCDPKYIDIDLSILSTKYEITEQYTDGKTILFCLEKIVPIIEYVSLGSSCSVAEQLNRHKLRTEAYPFDWIRTDKFSSIVESVKNNFTGFMELNKMGDINPKFPLAYDDNFPTENKAAAMKMSNKYGILFMHDHSDIEEQHIIVANKYNRRIERFNNLPNKKKVVFIREELKPNTLEEKDIHSFLSYLKQNNIDYTIVFVIHNPKNKDLPILKLKIDNVHIVNSTDKFVDWQRTNLDWNIIFKLTA